MKNSTIGGFALLGAFIIVAVFIVQLYWMRVAFDLQNKQFCQSVQVSLESISQNIERQKKSFHIMEIKQLSSDFYMLNIQGIIDTTYLHSALHKELLAKKISPRIEYGIYNNTSNKMIYGNYMENNFHQFIQNLPILKKGNYYVGISFPGRFSYLANAMGIWVFSTIVLVAITGFFFLSLFLLIKQKRLSEVQKEFVNNMTHEFKTPISAISLSADTLLNLCDKNQLTDFRMISTVIQKEANRLDTQVERILQMAKSEKLNVGLYKEKVDIHSMLDELLNMNTLILSNRTCISLNLQALKSHIIADKIHLRNILLNLIDNAIKYSDQQPLISISTEDTKRGLLLIIQDNGKGINKKYHQQIFKPFFRIPTGNVHAVRGFGIGLSYVKNIVRAHGWDILLQSEENKGAKFCISFTI